MGRDYFRRFAQRCRELGLRARTEVVREQLRLWAEEFDNRADASDGGSETATLERPILVQTPDGQTTDPPLS